MYELSPTSETYIKYERLTRANDICRRMQGERRADGYLEYGGDVTHGSGRGEVHDHDGGHQPNRSKGHRHDDDLPYATPNNPEAVDLEMKAMGT
jgi:hypothetical protein